MRHWMAATGPTLRQDDPTPIACCQHQSWWSSSGHNCLNHHLFTKVRTGQSELCPLVIPAAWPQNIFCRHDHFTTASDLSSGQWTQWWRGSFPAVRTMDVCKYKSMIWTTRSSRARELCKSRGARPGRPSLINLRFCGRKATLQPWTTRNAWVTRYKIYI